MTDDRPSEVLGALPRTRPHRRSDKRAARPANAAAATGAGRAPEGAPADGSTPESTAPTKRRPKAPRLAQPAQPEGIPPGPRARSAPPEPAPASRPAFLGTAVQAAAELAEIGLSVSARALRRAASRLPRP